MFFQHSFSICLTRIFLPRSNLEVIYNCPLPTPVRTFSLIAALIFSAGCYGAPIFTTRRGVLEKSFFLINFIGLIFEAGNETREKIWSDFSAEQKWRAERKKSGFCSYPRFWESEKLMCEKNFSKRAKFVHVRLLKAVFFANFDSYEVWLWYFLSFRLVLIGIEGFK